MSDHERSVMASLGCLEAIRSRATTLVDLFRHVTTYAGAMADTGLRLWLSESCADIDTRKIRHGD
jgi:5-methylthioadenosine/S-adenosylhomocysteine deaminase